MNSVAGIVSSAKNMLFNSKLWWYVYYKHTTKHKQDVRDVTDRVLAIRKQIIGK